jgi:hypothetical protein
MEARGSMAVATQYSEFLAAAERRRRALRSTPLHVTIVIGYGLICGVGVADINTGLLLLIMLAGAAALRAILKSLPVLGILALLVAGSVVFPVLAILPFGYGLYLLFRRIRFFLENFGVIILGLVLYGGALLLQVYGTDLAASVRLLPWVGAPIAGAVGVIAAHLLLLRAYAKGYTTRRAFEIMSIVPLLLLSLLLPLIKVAFDVHPDIGLDPHGTVGEAFAAGDAMASPVALAGEFGAAGAIAHAHAAHVGVHHDPVQAHPFSHSPYHTSAPPVDHDPFYASPPSHDVAQWAPQTPFQHVAQPNWHSLPPPVHHAAFSAPHPVDAQPFAHGPWHANAHVQSNPIAQVHTPAGQLQFAFHRQLDGTDHVVTPDAHQGISIRQVGNNYEFQSNGHVHHELRDVGGGRFVSEQAGHAHGVVAHGPGNVDGAFVWKNNLGQVRYEAQPFGGQILIKDAMTGQVVRTVRAQGWNAARFDVLVRGLG